MEVCSPQKCTPFWLAMRRGIDVSGWRGQRDKLSFDPGKAGVLTDLSVAVAAETVRALDWSVLSRAKNVNPGVSQAPETTLQLS
jgi:hypothetical protein